MASAGTFWAESVAIVSACCCCLVGPRSAAVVSCSSWRSRGVFPPQMPCCSLYVSAWSRQAALTGHSAQTRFALLVAPPGGGRTPRGRFVRTTRPSAMTELRPSRSMAQRWLYRVSPRVGSFLSDDPVFRVGSTISRDPDTSRSARFGRCALSPAFRWSPAPSAPGTIGRRYGG
jgi:hypothetical protein